MRFFKDFHMKGIFPFHFSFLVIYCRTGDNRELKKILMKPPLILYYYLFSYQVWLLIVAFWFVFFLPFSLFLFFIFISLFPSSLFFLTFWGVSCLVLSCRKVECNEKVAKYVYYDKQNSMMNILSRWCSSSKVIT